jgi:hypothetical protein
LILKAIAKIGYRKKLRAFTVLPGSPDYPLKTLLLNAF